MKDIYCKFDFGKNVCLLNLKSLDSFVISNKQLKNVIEWVNNDVNTDDYITRLRAEENDNGIFPTLVTSYKCNFSCTYCFEKKIDRCIDIMTPQDVKRIFEFLDRYIQKNEMKSKIEGVNIIGGEPLLPENKNTIKEIIETMRGRSVIITSNGTYLNEYIDLFKKNVKIKISLDGTENMHFSRRKTQEIDIYKKIIDNIKCAVEKEI